MTRDVVLICLDTVRHDYFQQYAGELQQLSAHSFDECRTASTWSVPSHASIFTEELPHQHSFHSATPAFDDLPREDTFLSALPNHRHVGISANPYASPIFGFDTLFDDFYHITSSMPYAEGLSPSKFWHESSTDGWKRYFEFLNACFKHEYSIKSAANGVISQSEKLFRKLPVAKPFDDGCKRLLNRARGELNRSTDSTFVFVNIMDAHGPLTNVRGYDQSLLSSSSRGSTPDLNALQMTLDETFEDYQTEIEQYRELYAAAIEYVSRQVAEFCKSVDDDTAVIITSDHGEQLVDDGREKRFGHVTPDMTEPLLHVPLEIVNADISVDETEIISHLDLGRIITAISNGESFEKQRPIAAEVAGLGVAHPPTDHEHFDYWNRVSRCVYDHTGKYVWDSLGSARYYERTDEEYVLKREGDQDIVSTEVKSHFATEMSEFGPVVDATDIDENVESHLEELGYL